MRSRNKTNKNCQVISGILALLIMLGAGIWMYFAFVRDAVITANETMGIAIPPLSIPIVGGAIGLLFVLFEKRLLSVSIIQAVANFFKKTQWIWLSLIILGIVALTFINK